MQRYENIMNLPQRVAVKNVNVLKRFYSKSVSKQIFKWIGDTKTID